MGQKLPKASNKTREGRDLNNRVEIIVHPPDVKVINSQRLPVLKDRERVVVTIGYSKGPRIKKLRVVERVTKGLRYVKGSGFFRGKTIEPKITGSDLVWDLGATDSSFAEALFYVLKKGKGAGPVPAQTRIVYVSSDREHSREFDPKTPAKRASTVKETCLKCHANVLSRRFKHGPVEAGYCVLCHDPHASPNPAWTRKPTWDLCTTCHTNMQNDVHVVAGFATGKTHPTKGKRDPARPGKRLTCSSCHDPHSAVTPYLLVFDVRSRSELCGYCHKK
jgi:predicted CXXCH cytochrome family protein